MTTIRPPNHTSTDHPQPNPYPQILLFGDSITEGAHSTLIPALSAQYLRRLDVLNRGFSGYTTVAAKPLLPSIFPALPPCSVPINTTTHSNNNIVPPTPNPRILLLTIFFGANDACLPPAAQHVPLAIYAQTLREMIRWQGVQMHNTTVLVLTPPPVDEWQLGPEPTRRAEVTKQYADAARAVAAEENNSSRREDGGVVRVEVVDVWRAFMREAGWSTEEREGNNGEGTGEYLPGDARRERNETLARLLSDGLHFTEDGYALVFEEMMRVIRDRCPELVPEKVPVVHPDWKTVFGIED